MNIKGIDPLWITIVATLVAIDQNVGSGKISLDHVFPGTWVPWIVGWCGFLAGILGYVVAALTTVISSRPGILVSPVSPAAKAIIILAVALTSLFAFPGDASAQSVLKPLRPLAARVATSPVAAPALPATDALTKLMNDLSTIQNEIVTGVIADITAADADAAVLTNPADPSSVKDPISHACYPAEIKFLQSLPVATPTTGKYVLVQLFQKKRDFIMQIQAGLPSYLKLGCAALLGDEVSIFTKTMGLIGVTVAANSLLPGSGLALPVLP